MRQRIIIIEDEADIVEMVRYNFRKEGFEVESYARGKDGLEAVRRMPPDLLLLDIMLPDEDGFSICRRLRADDGLRSLPVIFFTPRELVARAKAILRRQERAAADVGEVVEIRGLRLDARTQDVSVRGAAVDLSALEFKLLHFLASHPRQVFSRERLLDEVWGRDCSVTLRTVDVHIRRLREKIEAQPESPEYIGTVRGAGYRLLAEAQET